MTGGRPAVFLDRDGTLITETGYLADPEELRLFPGAGEAVRRLNEAGLRVVLVTNQSGVARGYFDEATLAAVHERLRVELARCDARLDAIYSCPHHPEIGEPPYRAACECRKPKPGLFLRAIDELGLDASASWAVGDAMRDLEAARAANIAVPIVVRTGKGEATWSSLSEPERAGVHGVADLTEAVSLILAAQGR